MAAPQIFRDNSTCVVLWVWLDSDPTAYDWVENFPIGVPLMRTDDNTVWRKSGNADTDWTQVGGGSGGEMGSFDVTEVFDATDSPVTATVGQLVRIDPTAGAVTVNLPAISAANEGSMVVVKATEYDGVNGATIAITPDGADTVDGLPALNITGNRVKGGAILVSDGVGNWEVIGSYQRTIEATDYSGDGAPDITIYDGDTVARIAATNDAEGVQTFIVPDGKENGQMLTIIAASSGFGMVVEVTSPGGEAGGTNTLAATTQGALQLVWFVDSWYTVSIIGFVNS